VCGGQPSPHKPRLVVSHSTCPPLSSSPHAHSFVLGTTVINTHAWYLDFPAARASARAFCSRVPYPYGGFALCCPNFGPVIFRSVIVRGPPPFPTAYFTLSFTLVFVRCSPGGRKKVIVINNKNDLSQWARFSSHALPFFSPPSFHTLSLSPVFTSVWWSVYQVRLVHTSFGSSYLITHVLHYPPPPTRTALY
jgi:hypothetical protein